MGRVSGASDTNRYHPSVSRYVYWRQPVGFRGVLGTLGFRGATEYSGIEEVFGVTYAVYRRRYATTEERRYLLKRLKFLGYTGW